MGVMTDGLMAGSEMSHFSQFYFDINMLWDPSCTLKSASSPDHPKPIVMVELQDKIRGLESYIAELEERMKECECCRRVKVSSESIEYRSGDFDKVDDDKETTTCVLYSETDLYNSEEDEASESIEYRSGDFDKVDDDKETTTHVLYSETDLYNSEEDAVSPLSDSLESISSYQEEVILSERRSRNLEKVRLLLQPGRNTLKAQLGLNDEQVREFKDAFDIFDEDVSGTVSTGELASVMRTLGQEIDEKEVGVMISEVDSDGSGEIDFSEFCTLMARQMEKADPEFEYKKAFKIFDKRGDGFIDQAELKHVMTNIGEEMSDNEIISMIKEADVDGDGKLNYEEFLNIMLAK